jgi:hypothetical protein
VDFVFILSRKELTAPRKFKAEFGIDALFEHYLPQYDLREQKHLPGLRFMWDEANKAVKMKKQKNDKASEGEQENREGETQVDMVASKKEWSRT